MMKSYFYIFAWILLASCAQIVSPTGGPRDTTPPVIESVNFQDSSLNFYPEKIIFKFDEVIKNENPQELISISPFTRVDPKIRVNYKELIIEFPDEALRKNTTYSLTLDGVSDVTEGNKMEPHSYIFSTGSFLDSLFISGDLKPAYPGMGSDKVQIYLYDASDSFGIIKATKPLFFGDVLSSGSFRVSSIPAGRYRVYALGDLNRNYRYDLPKEVIAFDTTIIDVDSSTEHLNLYSFTRVGLSQENKATPSDDYVVTGARTGNSVPQQGSGISWNFDTNATVASVDLYSPILIRSVYRVDTLDRELISLTDTTQRIIEPITVSLDSIGTKISIIPDSGFHSDHVYKLFIREKAIKDSSGWENEREVLYFRTLDASTYSSAKITLEPWDSAAQYVLNLKYDNKDTSIVMNPQKGYQVYLQHLTEGTINANYFIDIDSNGKYTNGNFDLRRQPEIIQTATEPMIIKRSWDHIYTIKTTNPKEVQRSSNNNRGGASVQN